MTDPTDHLLSLAAAGDWARAEDFARAQYEASASPDEARFWGVQLLGCCFLNERDVDATYSRAIEVAGELRGRFADDADVLAWCAWVQHIYGFDDEVTQDIADQALALDAACSLAHWLAASSDARDEPLLTRLGRLWVVLAAQPGNRHAQELAMALARDAGLAAIARSVARDVLTGPPFAATDLGVWTEYVNDVILGGYKDERVVAAARAILQMPPDE